MHPRCKARTCVLINVLTVAGITIGAMMCSNLGVGYMRAGPGLVVASVYIDTWEKWWYLVLLICAWSATDVFIHAIGTPVITFNVYNPDKRCITEFSRPELQFLTNLNSFASSIKSVFGFVIAISQIDVALIAVAASEVSSIITTHVLLREKTFHTHM